MIYIRHALLLSFAMSIATQLTLRVDVSLITVGVRVTDSRGRDVRGLKAEDFSLTEDGVRQRIASFSSEAQPIALGIVFDRSFSMEANGKIERAKEAARSLVTNAREGSEFFYVEFNEKVRVAEDFTGDRQAILSAIQRTEPEGSTSLYDAILEGLTMAGRAHLPRQALVVISDGADQHSSHELQQIIEIVRESQIQIYTIGYFSKEEEQITRSSARKLSLTNGAEVDNPRLALQTIAEDSGGISFFPRSDEALREAVTRINQDLLTQYSLGFYPEAPGTAGSYRSLKVTVRGNGYQIRSRPGYGTREFTPGNVRPKAEASGSFNSKVERRGGKFVYRDDFNDRSSGWPERESARYTQEGYRLSGENVVVSNGPEFVNFRAAVTIFIDEVLPPSNPLPRVGNSSLPTTGIQANPPGGGLLFRQTERGYYALILYPPNALRAGFAVAIRADNSGKTTELGRWPLLNRPARNREIEVQCREGTCEFSDGGAVLGRVSNIATDGGKVGLILRALGQALFHDLIVEEI